MCGRGRVLGGNCQSVPEPMRVRAGIVYNSVVTVAIRHHAFGRHNSVTTATCFSLHSCGTHCPAALHRPNKMQNL